MFDYLFLFPVTPSSTWNVIFFQLVLNDGWNSIPILWLVTSKLWLMKKIETWSMTAHSTGVYRLQLGIYDYRASFGWIDESITRLMDKLFSDRSHKWRWHSGTFPTLIGSGSQPKPPSTQHLFFLALSAQQSAQHRASIRDWPGQDTW